MAIPVERLQQQLDQQARQLQREIHQRELLTQQLATTEARCRRLEHSEFDRLQLEAALHQNQARLRQIAATVPGVIYDYVLHPDGSDSFLYVSPRCLDLFELEPEALLQDSQCLWRLVEPDDLVEVQAAVVKAVADLALFDAEFRVTTASGQQKWIQAISSPGDRLYSEDATIWSGFMLDITHRKQTELELQQAKETAVQEAARSVAAHQSKNAVFKALSHELRTPLNVILGFSQLLQRDQALTSKHQEYLETIHRSAADLLASLNYLLDISHSQQAIDPSDWQNILGKKNLPLVVKPSILEPSVLNSMPDHWLQQFHQAAVMVSNRRLLELVQQMPESQASVASSLMEKINNFDFEQIITLTQEAIQQRKLQ